MQPQRLIYFTPRRRRGWCALVQSDCVRLKRNLRGGSESGAAVQVCTEWCTGTIWLYCAVMQHMPGSGGGEGTGSKVGQRQEEDETASSWTKTLHVMFPGFQFAKLIISMRKPFPWIHDIVTRTNFLWIFYFGIFIANKLRVLIFQEPTSILGIFRIVEWEDSSPSLWFSMINYQRSLTACLLQLQALHVTKSSTLIRLPRALLTTCQTLVTQI